MPDSKLFDVPFGNLGDKATIPTPTQPGGSVSYNQGFGPDYERDLATDPLAKPVPRDGTNELYYQITNALKYIQLYGAPEWFSVDSSGNPVSYPKNAMVRFGSGATTQVWRSLVDANTVTPGTDPAKWTLDEAFSIAVLESTLAQAVAGTNGTTIITPRRLASSVQQGKWSAANASGTNALTASLSPAPAALADLTNAAIRLKIAATNTGAVTLNLNGTGALPVVTPDGVALPAGSLLAGAVVTLVYDGSKYQLTGGGNAVRGLGGISIFNTSGSFTVPDGVFKVLVEVWGAGGGGGGGSGSSQAGGGGGGGGYSSKLMNTTPGTVFAVTVGAAGNAGAIGAGTAGAGGTTTATDGTTTISATGGAGGYNGGSGALGGAPGNGAGGDEVITGGGGFSFQSAAIAGAGGSAPRGGSGSQQGNAGNAPGGGGGGAAATNPGTIGGQGRVKFSY